MMYDYTLNLKRRFYMVQAYGIGGVFSVQAAALSGFGPPPATFFGEVGQNYFDKLTAPPTQYTFNGQTWAQAQTALTLPLTVANGGTGDATLTPYAVLTGGTTATGALQSIASVGTSGQVLTSNGAGALPTFQASGGGGSIQSVTVTLTSAQFKAINVTPFTIVPAQGLQTVIYPLTIVLELVYGGANAFTGSGEIRAYWGTVVGSNGLTNTKDNSFFGLTESTLTSLIPTQIESGTFAVADIENQPITLQCDAAIAGNASNNNTIRITTYYTLVTIV